MRFKIDYTYEEDGITRQGCYITNDPQEFIQPMRQQYGDKITFHIMGARK